MGTNSNSFIRFEREGQVGLLLIDRSAKANAYTDAMVRTADGILDRILADATVRSLVITSAADGWFSAGADLGEIRSRSEEDGFTIPSLALFDRIEGLPIPVIAAINGPAVAGGLELALACDVRIASPGARFALPETRLGILPAAGATWRLPRAVGQPLARQIILFGRELSGEEAVQAGLADFLVPDDELLEEARAWALLAAARDPLATRLAKEALARAHGSTTGREFVEECQAQLYSRQNKRGSQ